MANSRILESGKRKAGRVSGHIDREGAARVAGALGSVRSGGSGEAVQLLVGAERRVALPRRLAVVVARAAKLLAQGHEVAVVADDEVLTTQGAADRLNVSRQYVVRLVDQGDLPAVRVGSHRRLRASHVEAYRIQRDAEREAALDRLTEASEELGGYGTDR